MAIVIVGVPRTEYTLAEAVVQARLRGLPVFVADTNEKLAGVPPRLDVSTLLLDNEAAADAAARTISAVAPRQVVAFTEFHLTLAAAIRERLGIEGTPFEVEERIRDKEKTRRCLATHGLTAVRFATTSLRDLEQTASEFDPPFVIKPLDLTGSVGVHAVRTRDEVARFHERFVDVVAESRRARRFLIESFVAGDEYSVEGICAGGEFHLLAVTLKYTDGFPTFAEIGHRLPANERVDTTACRAYLQSVTRALGIVTAPIHAEVKIEGSAIDLIEIHTRFGGDSIPELFERAFGRNMFRLYYDALFDGVPPATCAPRCVSGIQFFETHELPRLTVPPARQGVRYTLSVQERNGQHAPVLDNFRILNARGAQLIFDAATPADADAFAGEVRRMADAGR